MLALTNWPTICRPVALTALLLLAGLAVQPTPTRAQSGSAWVHNCEKAKDTGKQLCRISQNLVVEKGGKQQRLLTVAIRPKQGSLGYAMLFALPHGLHLPSGVEISIDSRKPKKLVIQTSDARGAYTGTNLDSELLASMKQGSKMTVKMVTNARKKVGLAVKLDGFTAAYDKLEGAN